MDATFLQLFWFILLGVLLVGYAVLDGFDLGVGILHLAVGRNDRDRRVMMNSIGPLWDGNEVWLVTFGGALFAAFPEAYATAFSAFYLPFMLLLFALIFRGVSMEFRSKRNHPLWRGTWDVAFFGSSTLATFLFGVAVGNSMIGLPIQPVDQKIEFVGQFFDLLRPYPFLVGELAVATFAMHGAIYLYLKTEGELQQRARQAVWVCFGLFLAAFLIVTAATLINVPRSIANFSQFPWAWIIVLLAFLAILNIPRAMKHGWPGFAFLSSACTIAALVFLFGIALFPDLMTSTIDTKHSLTIVNASSSEKTLGIMMIIAFLGMPFVLAYTAAIYWVFRGKVEMDQFSY